jgi:hypothetical protein
MLQITFEKTLDSHGIVFRDAIVLPDDHGLTQDEIEAIKDQRFQAWADAVLNPPEPEESPHPLLPPPAEPPPEPSEPPQLPPLEA